MARVTIEDCLRKVSNRFMLVHLGAKRVTQLRKGAKPLVEAPKNKEVVVALREIAAGAVGFDNVALIEQDQLSPKHAQVSPEVPDETTDSLQEKEEATPAPAAEGNADAEVDPEDVTPTSQD